MKINIKITDKERRFLYRLLAVVLSVQIFAVNSIALQYIVELYEWQTRGYLAIGFILSVPMWTAILALLKHYR